MNRQRLSAPVFYYGLLILGYLLFIALASFYLTGAVSLSRAARAGADEMFFLPGEFRLRLWNLRDISTNLLLYMPLGFLVAMFLGSRGKSLNCVTHLWWGTLLSIGVETGQAFIGRYSDATDVVANGVGYLLGFLIARASIVRFGVQPASLLGFASREKGSRLHTLSGLRFIYVAVALVAALLPFDLSVSVTQVYGKLQATDNSLPRLIVDPLYHFKTGFSQAQYLTLKVLLYLPLAFLSSVIQLRRGRTSLFIPAFHCLFLGATVECANLFIRSGRSDTFIPLLAFLTGLAMAGVVVFFGRRMRQGTTAFMESDRQYLLISIGLLYTLLLLAVALSPYAFELSLGAIRDKFLTQTNLIPFRLHFSARSIASAIDIVREFILYAPLGTLLALWLPGTVLRPSVRATLVLAVLLGLGFALWVEALQLAVVGRYVDITDVLLAAAGSLSGAVIAPLFRVRRATGSGS